MWTAVVPTLLLALLRRMNKNEMCCCVISVYQESEFIILRALLTAPSEYIDILARANQKLTRKHYCEW